MISFIYNDNCSALNFRYLKTIDKFNELNVTGFVTASSILSISQINSNTHVHVHDIVYLKYTIQHSCKWKLFILFSSW